MAITNQERVGKALELLRVGLGPFVEREIAAAKAAGGSIAPLERQLADPMLAGAPIAQWDAAALLKLMTESWNEVFRKTLGRAERSLVQELRDWRNEWAHQKPFSGDDTERALDSAARLLAAVSAAQAEEVATMRTELRRLRFEEQLRSEARKSGGSLLEAAASGNLKPWREVVTPHKDVASGNYQQAEFAADLWQVHLGQGGPEYSDAKEFFRRTFLTESLQRLLIGAIQRLHGRGGDPVVQLQTNFGGGKTHSMLALYHLVSGIGATELAGVDDLLGQAGMKKLPTARRVVLVGNKISPGNPITKSDGTVVRTLWGELAWQLGGRAAYEKVRADDEHATSPGDTLRQLFVEYGPCLVLIDEWVAYARQLHDQSDLPAGGFETQFSFAQALTESAKLAGNCLLVVSLPASDTSGSPHTSADDVEVGGIRGREALDRLRNVVGRVESSWRPASAEEGFEIVRRRLFEPLPGSEFKNRDITARAFAELYRSQSAEFPNETRSGDYERRLQTAYPIHPEVFDQLYGTWSTLVKFQRTRGVLRLMAAVIHSLWEKGDKAPLILPSTIPIDDSRVRFELTRYLSDQWDPIISRDIDGPGSLPLAIDAHNTNLGKLSATRRVARTVYLGSAPAAGTAHHGIDDRRIKLGCVFPGESPQIFGDALRRLAGQATYLYQDGQRYWYSTQPTVTKVAEDRAEQLKRDPDKVADELERRVRADLKSTGDFARVHPLPRSSADVGDDLESRLVVLAPDVPHTKDGESKAIAAAREILENRGSAPRLYRNTLVFLAADRARMQDLDEALRRFLAWDSILAEREALNLDPHQVRQAETQRQGADGAVVARLPETYHWLIVPEQVTPQAQVTWESLKLTGTEPLAVRASRKLRSEELMVTSVGATVVRSRMDEIPLWQGDHVEVRALVDHYARYLYLQRLASPHVLASALGDGVGLLSWARDGFAYADGWDDVAGRYRGLRAGTTIALAPDAAGLIVKPAVATAQLEAEARAASERASHGVPATGGGEQLPTPTTTEAPAAKIAPKRFYGRALLDPIRTGLEASRIAEEVIAHLSAQPGGEVRITLEIEARVPQGAGEHLVRTVSENARALKFTNFEFESE